MDRVHEDVTVETMCGFGNVVTMLGLARDEMRSLQSPFDGPYPAGLVLFDDPPDVWCAARGASSTARARRGVCDSRRDGHAARFATRPDARRRVVATVAELVGGRKNDDALRWARRRGRVMVVDAVVDGKSKM